MNNFRYLRAEHGDAAIALASGHDNAKFLAGGTNLIDLMRENIEQPSTIIDISGLLLDQVTEKPDGGLAIGATVRNTALANHPLVRERYPLLTQAIVCGASGQIRNMATTGGNLMQRTRCHYFYDKAAHCNKRHPGTGCDALAGFNRMHAVLGASEHCIATHPSDMCVALAALDAVVQVQGTGGQRAIGFDDFHLLPGSTPQIETSLQRGELITAIHLPALACAGNSLYRKIRDRASYAFALVSIAAALKLENGVITEVRIALGGVAHKPWRARQAERILTGTAPGTEVFRRAAEAELAAAKAHEHNAFKIELMKRCIVGAMEELSARERAQ